jgi:predicted ArsR family transcriptional regulator
MTRQPGNPLKRSRGEAVRAVILATCRPNTPIALDTAMAVLNLSHSGILRHLAQLQAAKRIKGYTTANGVVRVW